MTGFNMQNFPNELSCDLPRKPKAIEALLGLAWRKGKRERPTWLTEELTRNFETYNR